MGKKIIKRAIIPLLLSLTLLPIFLQAEEDKKREHEIHSNANPLIEEMLTLDRVFHEVVSGVALGDGARVHKALESMHGTKEKTHKGIHSGIVKIPKNAERIEEFVKLDESFHNDLETLARAAHENNQNKMLSLAKKLLDACVRCHEIFR